MGVFVKRGGEYYCDWSASLWFFVSDAFPETPSWYYGFGKYWRYPSCGECDVFFEHSSAASTFSERIGCVSFCFAYEVWYLCGRERRHLVVRGTQAVHKRTCIAGRHSLFLQRGIRSYAACGNAHCQSRSEERRVGKECR